MSSKVILSGETDGPEGHEEHLCKFSTVVGKGNSCVSSFDEKILSAIGDFIIFGTYLIFPGVLQ